MRSFAAVDRRLAFCPRLPDAWFELARGEGLKSRAVEVFTKHLRDCEKKDNQEEFAARLAPLANKQRPWVSLLELRIDAHKALQRETRDRFALLGGGESLSGAAELHKVGRCLDRLYPDGLTRALGRQPFVEQLRQLLPEAEPRPLMLVGPPLVGKTAIVHEFVFQCIERRKQPFQRDENVWHISPQRLISGMSYVGQWENRLLAILKETQKHRHVLYFDDLVGAYRAGLSTGSNLSVADVLKSAVQRGQVRLLAETTAEGLRVFRERDRGFADLFHLILHFRRIQALID